MRRVLIPVLLVAAPALNDFAFAQADDDAAVALKEARAECAAVQEAVEKQQAAAEGKEKLDPELKARLRAAQQRLQAEQAWTAQQEVARQEEAVAAATEALTTKTTQAKAAAEKAAEAEKEAAKADAERAEAEKALQDVPQSEAEKRAAARKVVEEKKEAAKQAEAAVAAAQKAAEKATQEKAAAEQSVAEKEASLTKARDAAAIAHAEALGGLKPITSDQWDYAKARHLLFRAGFGGTPEEVRRLVAMGPHKAVEYLVQYHQHRPAAIEPDRDIYTWERPLAYQTRLHREAQNRLTLVDGKRNVDQHATMVRWWVRRLLESPRPLEEKLVLFWHDHFASSYRTLGEAYLMYQQNQLLRLHADNFEALLHGIVQDPAMIRYLNNDENVHGANNENLGRELLELFSLGEENSAAHREDGYTEKDVRDGNTRALTGAGYDHYSGQYRFRDTQHDPDPKTLLGQTGNWGVHEAVDIMLEHPATAQYVTKKLWQYFAHWDPEPEVLDRLASVLRENNYRIRPLLENIFLSEQFYSEEVMGSHIKSPVELLVGTTKVLDMSGVSYQDIRFLLASMGQSLFDPPSVAGWAEGRDWVNTNLLMARYTATADMIRKKPVNFVALLEKERFENSDAVVDHFVQRCLTVELSSEKRQSLIEFLGPLPPSSQWDEQAEEINAKLTALLVLLVSSPEYQVS